MAIKDTLTTVTDGFKTTLDDEMLQRFEIYFKLLVEWNEKMNLTAITDEHGVAVKHFADSLTLYNFVDVKKNASIIDVGTGLFFITDSSFLKFQEMHTTLCAGKTIPI